MCVCVRVTGWVLGCWRSLLGIRAPEGQSSLIFASVFVITWCGAAVVTVNAQLLGGTLSFFQSVCVLGTCTQLPARQLGWLPLPLAPACLPASLVPAGSIPSRNLPLTLPFVARLLHWPPERRRAPVFLLGQPRVAGGGGGSGLCVVLPRQRPVYESTDARGPEVAGCVPRLPLLHPPVMGHPGGLLLSQLTNVSHVSGPMLDGGGAPASSTVSCVVCCT